MNENQNPPATQMKREWGGGREGGLSDKWSLSVLLTCWVGWLRWPSRVAVHQNWRGGWFVVTDSFCPLYRLIKIVRQPGMVRNTNYLKLGKLDNWLTDSFCPLHRLIKIVWQPGMVRNTNYLKLGKLDNWLSGIFSVHSTRKSGIDWCPLFAD